MTFGQRLANARKSAGVSQRGLAKILHVSHGAVANWESGLSTPDPDTLARIAAALRVSADDLIGTSDLFSSGSVRTTAAHANPPPPGVDPDEWERQARKRLEELIADVRRDWEETQRKGR